MFHGPSFPIFLGLLASWISLTAGSQSGDCACAYGMDWNGKLYSIDLPSGDTKTVADTGYNFDNMAINRAENKMYFIETNFLLTLSLCLPPDEGNRRRLQWFDESHHDGILDFDRRRLPVDPADKGRIRASAYNPADGLIYAVLFENEGRLITLDPADLKRMTIGQTGLKEVTSLSFTTDNGGDLIAFNRRDGIYSLDWQGDASATLISAEPRLNAESFDWNVCGDTEADRDYSNLIVAKADVAKLFQVADINASWRARKFVTMVIAADNDDDTLILDEIDIRGLSVFPGPCDQPCGRSCARDQCSMEYCDAAPEWRLCSAENIGVSPNKCGGSCQYIQCQYCGTHADCLQTCKKFNNDFGTSFRCRAECNSVEGDYKCFNDCGFQ